MTIYTDGIRVRQGQSLEEFQAGFGDYLGAKVDQSLDDSATGSIYRASELTAAMYGPPDVSVDQMGNPISVDFTQGPDSPTVKKPDALARIKESGLDGKLTVPDNGLPSRALDILIDRKHAELARADFIERAPNRYAVAGLPAAIATQILDPVNVAAMFIPAVGEERFASILGTVGARAAAGTINGLVGSAAVEPFTYLAHTQEQADYTTTDALTNIAFGSILGGGLHVGIGFVGDRIRIGRENAAKPGDVPRETFAGPEQRTDAQTRANIDAMPPAQQQSEIEWLRAERQRLENELGTDELTGLRNRRAFANDEPLPIKAMLDVDSLKWVNDNLGHEAGDNYLRAVGEAMQRAGIDRGYRLSGDEFAFQAHTPEAATEMRTKLEAELQKATVRATLPDGTVLTKKGVGVSYGHGTNRAEADAALYRNKSDRAAAGQRSVAGVEPPGVARSAAARDEAGIFGASDAVIAKTGWQTQRAALSTAVAQMAEGRAPEVDALVHTDPRAPGEPATLADVQHAAERSDSPAGSLLTRPEDAARPEEPELVPPDRGEALASATEQAQAATDDLRATMAGVKGEKPPAGTQSATRTATAEARQQTADLMADLPAAVRKELAEFDDLVDDAETYGRAARAAAACWLRS